MSTMNMSRLTEWERALPAPDELTPLSQSLIPPELACAFNIPRITSSTITAAIAGANGVTAVASTASPTSESPLLGMRSALLPTLVGDQNSEAVPPAPATVKENTAPSDPGALHRQQNVEFSSRKGEDTGVTIRLSTSPNGCSPGSLYGISPVSNGLPQYMASSWPASSGAEVGLGFEDNSVAGGESQVQAGNATKVDPNEEVDSGSVVDSHQSTSSMAVLGGEEQSARTLKKPRLVWTPQLHGRFVEAVGQLGIRNAVPKTIMQLMNVEGLTRENVASHLQKYRLYLKRLQQGLPNEGPSASDHLFASTPVPPGLASSSHYLVSHHPHQQDHAFGVNVSTVISHNSHIGAATISPPVLPFSGFSTHAVFPNAPRPAAVPVPASVPLRDSFPRPPSSPPRRALTLFPTNGS